MMLGELTTQLSHKKNSSSIHEVMASSQTRIKIGWLVVDLRLVPWYGSKKSKS